MNPLLFITGLILITLIGLVIWGELLARHHRKQQTRRAADWGRW